MKEEDLVFQTKPGWDICPLGEGECSEIKNKETFEKFCNGNYENCQSYRLNRHTKEDN